MVSIILKPFPAGEMHLPSIQYLYLMTDYDKIGYQNLARPTSRAHYVILDLIYQGKVYTPIRKVFVERQVSYCGNVLVAMSW